MKKKRPVTNVGGFTFVGKYCPRSSKPGNKGIAGEKELFERNPGRVPPLLEITGWPKLYLGSLNLTVPNDVVTNLGRLRELYFEHPSLIEYPNGQRNMAQERGGYNYYWGEMTGPNGMQEILIR